MRTYIVFRGAFSAGGFKESVELSTNMPEDDSKVFELFTYWLYRGSVTHPTSAEDFDHLVDLYIFTEKLCINEVANKTTDAMISGYHDKEPEMTRERVEKIWTNTSPTSPLRKWCVHALVDIFCDFGTPDKKKESPGFLTERNLVLLWHIIKDNCAVYTVFFDIGNTTNTTLF